jgi:hypothetical protein
MPILISKKPALNNMLGRNVGTDGEQTTVSFLKEL